MITDPLSDVTRKERRVLLAVSSIGIIISLTGLIPKKITALGIEFAPKEQNLILLVIVGLILYFLIAFIIYAWTDYSSWRSEFAKWLLDTIPPIPESTADESYYNEMAAQTIHDLNMNGDIEGAFQAENEQIRDKMKLQLENHYRKQNENISIASKIRVYFEFTVPIIVAIVAIYFLISTDIKENSSLKNTVHEKCYHKKI